MPKLFDKLLDELSGDAVEITSASAKRLYNAFQKGFQGSEGIVELKPLHILEPLKPQNQRAERTELIVSRVTLEEATGRCPRSGAQLRLIDLESSQKQKLREGLMSLASTSYEKRSQEKNDKATKALKMFGEWLE